MKTEILFLIWFVLCITYATAATSSCSGSRGACTCDCAWATSATCGNDDGSCCFSCCCAKASTITNAPTSTTPTATTKVPSSTSSSSPSAAPSSYCPSSNDFIVAYGSSPKLVNQGWDIQGGGGVASKASFNLLGGSVEYDIDFTNVNVGVNANIYSISPTFPSSGFTQSNYCDGQKSGSAFCVEVDWIESNGNCGGASALHTKEGTGVNGCNAWGCNTDYKYSGKPSFHMKVEFALDGSWTITRDGQVIMPSALSPSPQAIDWTPLVQQFKDRGALVYSSQWVGWVPVSSCGSSGDLASSKFSVRNLVIRGNVVQGPAPRLCDSSVTPSPARTWTPTSPPTNPAPSTSVPPTTKAPTSAPATTTPTTTKPPTTLPVTSVPLTKVPTPPPSTTTKAPTVAPTTTAPSSSTGCTYTVASSSGTNSWYVQLKVTPLDSSISSVAVTSPIKISLKAESWGDFTGSPTSSLSGVVQVTVTKVGGATQLYTLRNFPNLETAVCASAAAPTPTPTISEAQQLADCKVHCTANQCTTATLAKVTGTKLCECSGCASSQTSRSCDALTKKYCTYPTDKCLMQNGINVCAVSAGGTSSWKNCTKCA